MVTRHESRWWYSLGLVLDIGGGLGLLLLIAYWHGVGMLLGCWLMAGAPWGSPVQALFQFTVCCGLFLHMGLGIWPCGWVNWVMDWSVERVVRGERAHKEKMSAP